MESISSNAKEMVIREKRVMGLDCES